MKRFVFTTLVMLAVGFATVGADEPTEEEAEQLTGSCGEIRTATRALSLATICGWSTSSRPHGRSTRSTVHGCR